MKETYFTRLLVIVCSLFPFFSYAQQNTSSCESILIQTIDNELVISGLDIAKTKARIYDTNYQLVSTCEFDCAASINIPDVNDGAVYHLTIEFFSDNFDYLTQEQIDYSIGTEATEIGICLGNVTLANQAAVDAFCGCEIITGILDIGGQFTGVNDIDDLSNLSNIKIVSDLIVVGTNLISLAALENLKTGRRIGIYNNDLLESIDAFSQIETIQNLEISSNPSLKQLNAFQQLKEALLIVNISNNNQLTKLNGFGNLEIANGFSFQNNDAFLVLDEMVALRVVADFFSIRENNQLKEVVFADLTGNVAELIISNNPFLEKLPAIGGITIAQGLQIFGNTALNECCALATLLDADLSNGHNGGILNLKDNGILCNSSLSILENCGGTSPANCEVIMLSSENNQLTINGINAPIAIIKVYDENYQLIFDCTASCEETITLDNLKTGDIYHTDIQFYDENWQFICEDKQDVEILGGGDPCGTICQGNVTLRTQAEVDAFCGCEIIEGDMVIGYRPDEGDVFSDIVNLENLKDLKQVKGQLIIGRTELTQINGLSQLKEVDGLVIIGNLNLSSIDGLDSLDKIHINFFTANNPNLRRIDVLGNLTFLGSFIVFSGAFDQLPQFDKLENESFNQLLINQCPNLQSLQGLEKITSIRGTATINPVLEVFLNPILTDISALQQLELVEGRLNISVNSLLADCCSIAHLVDDNPDNGVVNGEVAIFRNDSFCNSVEEILANCGDTSPFSCDNIKVDYANNDLTISGLTAPIEIVKIFDKDWQLLFECFADCEETITLSNVNSAIFRVQIANYDEDWNFLCHGDQDLIPAEDRTLNQLVAEDFSLYPNPAYESVYLDLSLLEETKITLTILNQFGQKMYEKRMEKGLNKQEKIDISNFSNGLYFLQIQEGNRKPIGKRLVVNRLY